MFHLGVWKRGVCVALRLSFLFNAGYWVVQSIPRHRNGDIWTINSLHQLEHTHTRMRSLVRCQPPLLAWFYVCYLPLPPT
jgi:hypothetical protein